MDDIFSTRATGEGSSDADLLTRCRADDPAALRELYLAHRGSVWGVVARMISNDADREEVAQEVFLQIFRSLSGFRQTSKLSTWVHRVAVNVTLQHIRRKGRRLKLHLMETPPPASTADDTGGGEESPEDGMFRRDRQEVVRRVLDTLPAKKRIVLVLADFMGKSSSEISEIVGAPALTVRTRLFYARKEFYDRLGKEPSFEDLAPRGEDA